MGACDAGFGNCDMLASNGCDVNTRASTSHCGACGTACSFANASAACTAGACGLAACNAGFGNCDMNPANGCEVDVRVGARSVADFRTWGYSGTLGCNRIAFNVFDIGGGAGARARCRYGILLNNEGTCEGSVDGGRGLGCRGYYDTQISAGQGDGIVATSHERGWIFVR